MLSQQGEVINTDGDWEHPGNWGPRQEGSGGWSLRRGSEADGKLQRKLVRTEKHAPLQVVHGCSLIKGEVYGVSQLPYGTKVSMWERDG